MEPAPGFADAHLPEARRCVQCAGAGETRGLAGSRAVEARLPPATLAAGEGGRRESKYASHPRSSQFTVGVYHSRSQYDQALLSSLFSYPPEILRKYTTFQ